MVTATKDSVPLARAMAALGLDRHELDELMRLTQARPHKELCLTVEEYVRIAEEAMRTPREKEMSKRLAN